MTERAGHLPDAVVSDRVPASSDEELGACPDRPRLWRPRALLLLPAEHTYTHTSTQSLNKLLVCVLHKPVSFKAITLKISKLTHLFTVDIERPPYS